MLDTAALIERLEKLPQRSRHGSKDALDERHGHMGLRFRQNKSAEMLSLGVTPGFVTPSCMAAITTPTVSVATNSRELVTSMSLPHGMTPGLTPRLIAIHSSAHVPLRGILKRPSSEPTLFTPSLTETMIQARAKRHIQLGKVRDQPGVKSPDLENTSKLYDARGSQEMGSLETEQSVSLVVSKCCNSFDDDDSNSVSLSVPKTSNEMAKLNSAPPATSEQRTETHSISLHTKMDFQPQYNTEPIEMLQGYSTYMTMHSDRVNQSELGARATDTCHTSCSSQSEDRALNGVRSPSPWAMDSSEMKTS
ncbi:uncharacterized protein LOC101845480 [Aplysia californica]|uniref:Uncharacterized protein LOC101845480 n=1 Tax=Aplysia californica TaxID=6500 RepID=A0ABM0JW39_APLCA|nr:uncharacterized protein LOC101845480 [Aplysia californica]